MKAVVTYKYRSSGVCGQTLGADGSGEYAIIVSGNPENVDIKLRDIMKSLGGSQYYYDIVVVTDEERYHGSSIRVYKV